MVAPVIDLKLLRENPDIVRASQRARGEDPALVDALLEADASRRAAVSAADNLRAEQKAASKLVGKASPEERPALLQKAKDLAEQVKAAEVAQADADTAFTAAHMAIANVVIDGVPSGGEDDFALLETVGEPRAIENPKDHLELGEALGLIDMERGAKVSGSRFYFLTGHGALLQLGLLQLAAQLAVANGFTLMIPPVLVRPEVMAGTGFLGAHADEVYRLEADDLYLVGTSEVPLAGYHSDEILDLSAGPRRYAGWSSCFRREAGSYGKDTRGIIRVHQFDKVEGFVYCKPEDAEAEHQRLLGWQRQMLAAIGVPYRVIDVAAGDLGSSAARKYDCEAWVPTQQTYRELTSTSNCTTFQARRLSTRYRDENGKPQIAATLNGTLATTRWLVAILENHQQPDGSVRVPEALVPFVGTAVLEPAK
jgi:seryl-tRNA synthetase